MTRSAEDESKLKNEDDLKPTLLVDESSPFNVPKADQKADNKNSENTTEFPKSD